MEAAGTKDLAWGPFDRLMAPLLWGLAVALRWPFLGSQAYGDEGVHFYMTKHWTAPPANFSDVFGQLWFHPSYIVYQRPLYYLLFHPAALVSFEAFRIQNLLVGALLPVVAYGLLRRSGTRKAVAVAAGLVCAGLPYFIVWGSFGLMDTTMTVLLLAGLWARQAKRPLLSAALLLAAVWSKETAYFAVVVLLAFSYLARWRKREAGLWPIRLDAQQSGEAVVLAIGLLPLMVGFAHGLQTPGGEGDAPNAYILEEAFWSSWLVPVLLLGLRWRTSRWFAASGLAAGFFFVIIHAVLHRGIGVWYNVPSVALTVVGIAATLDAAWTAWRRHPWAPALGSAAVCGLLLAGAFVPESQAKAALQHPLHVVPSGSYADDLDYQHHVRDQDLIQMKVWVRSEPFSTLLLFDVEYSHALYPFVDQLPHVLGGTSLVFAVLPHPVGVVADAIGQNGTLTVLEVRENAYNQAVRAVFADCVIHHNVQYVVIHGGCAGRAALLEAKVVYPRAGQSMAG